jgi:hypothetical protein
MMSASLFGFRSLTWPGTAPRVRACTCSAGSTRRTVTGISATPLGSASRSTTPKGEAANLASGGIRPVATLSGKLSGEASGRPDASSNFGGSVTVNGVCSAKGPAKLSDSTTPSSSRAALSSNCGLKLLPAPSSVMAAASLRATGALKRSTIGFSGRQADCAFSRSQLNETAKGSRTSKLSRRSTLLTTPEGVATPLP